MLALRVRPLPEAEGLGSRCEGPSGSIHVSIITSHTKTQGFNTQVLCSQARLVPVTRGLGKAESAPPNLGLPPYPHPPHPTPAISSSIQCEPPDLACDSGTGTRSQAGAIRNPLGRGRTEI